MAIAEDKRRLATRVIAIQVFVLAIFLSLVGSFWFMQIAQHAKFKEMAENNHQRTLPLRAPRGIIFDRHGRVVVENRNSFNISILREHTKNLERTISLLAQLTGVSVEEMRETIARHRHEPSYRPIVVVNDATLDQVAAVVSRRLEHELPDVVVQEVPTRQYPSESLAAHLLGYVSEANESQVAEGGLSLGTIVGQTGVEKNYNDMLMGRDGARIVVVNSMGREIRKLEEIPPVEGKRVQLTLNLSMQKAAEEGFRALGYWGSAIVLDPRSGDVLTLVSLPAYDPNAFAAGIDQAAYQALISDKLRPLQNRAIQGRYSPGSTFKLVVATAGLEEGVITPSFRVNCPGGAVFYGRYFQCHLKGGHGSVDLRHAIEKSCNVYFYTVGNMVGIDRIHKWGVNLGLHGRTGIDLPNEQDSLVPSSEWKKQRTGERWYPGETISVSIGQGQNAVTPMSLALMMTTLANGGTRHVPRLVKAVDDGSGWKEVAPPHNPYTAFKFKPETKKAIHDGLWLAVNGAGTAGRARIEGRDVAGKTGTAQVISLQGKERARGSTRDLRDHGWFVFMVPRDNPELAGAIFAEHNEHGYLAAPIARHIIETYYAEKEGRPLPPFPTPNVPAARPVRAATAVASNDRGGRPAPATRATPPAARPGGPGR
jgi:penicillin-binding protein 2